LDLEEKIIWAEIEFKAAKPLTLRTHDKNTGYLTLFCTLPSTAVLPYTTDLAGLVTQCIGYRHITAICQVYQRVVSELKSRTRKF